MGEAHAIAGLFSGLVFEAVSSLRNTDRQRCWFAPAIAFSRLLSHGPCPGAGVCYCFMGLARTPWSYRFVC